MGTSEQGSQVMAALGRAAAYGVASLPARALIRPGDAVQFLCDQVAATILARRLIIAVDDTPVLECEAASGRLMACRDPRQPDDAAIRFDDPGDAQATEAAAQALAQLLDRLSKGKARIALEGSLRVPSSSAGGGIAAPALAQALRLLPAGTDPVAVFDAFLQAAKVDMLAAARLHEDLLFPLLGDDAQADHLADLAADLLPGIEALPTWPVDGPAFLCLQGKADGPAILAAVMGGQWLIGLAQPAKQARLAGLWTSVI